MIVQVGGVVHVVAAEDTMTANSADGMFILVLGMGNLAEATESRNRRLDGGAGRVVLTMLVVQSDGRSARVVSIAVRWFGGGQMNLIEDPNGSGFYQSSRSSVVRVTDPVVESGPFPRIGLLA